MPIDPNVFNNIKTFADYNRADQDFQLKKALEAQAIQSGGIDAASKANIYATQLLSGAAAGGQPAYDQARQTLAAQGIDTSNYAPDVQTASQQLQAARLAQSPIGSLLNTGLKMDSNDLAKASLTGVLPSGSNVQSIIGNIIPNQGTSQIPGQNPMLPKLVQAESGGNPNAVSQAGAQGIAQIMPATAKDPGYGVTPLQGWDGVNPATAPVQEQLRFANDYLNAMQQHNGGNPQLAAASYNAGPGRVDAALAQLPQETQNYVAKVAPFNPPAQAANETLPAYKDRVQMAFEQYKLNNAPAMAQANAAASEVGKAQGAATKEAAGSQEGVDQIVQNIEALKTLAPNVPQERYGIPASAKAWVSQNFGDQSEANNYKTFSTINEAQGINAIKALAATGQIRMNQRLEAMINRGYLVDPNASPQEKVNQANAIEVELKNAATNSQNVNARLNGGAVQPYASPLVNQPLQSVNTSTAISAPPNGTLYGTSGGKPVYKMPDGTFLMGQ